VLRAHCGALGRDYDEITKTCCFWFDVWEKGEKAGETVDRLGQFAEMGLPGGDQLGHACLGHHAAGNARQRSDPGGREPLIRRLPAGIRRRRADEDAMLCIGVLRVAAGSGSVLAVGGYRDPAFAQGVGYLFQQSEQLVSFFWRELVEQCCCGQL
jgi:hypothetical protein